MAAYKDFKETDEQMKCPLVDEGHPLAPDEEEKLIAWLKPNSRKRKRILKQRSTAAQPKKGKKSANADLEKGTPKKKQQRSKASSDTEEQADDEAGGTNYEL